MSGVGRFIRKRRAKRAAFMADPAISLVAGYRVPCVAFMSQEGSGSLLLIKGGPCTIPNPSYTYRILRSASRK